MIRKSECLSYQLSEIRRELLVFFVRYLPRMLGGFSGQGELELPF